MKKILRFIFWALVALALYGFMFRSADIVAGLAPSDKLDQQCTGLETVGRCADKCPNPTDNLVGYDKETGAAVCNPAPTGCPYGDAVPLGPDCDRLAPYQTVDNPPTPVVNPATINANASDFGGK